MKKARLGLGINPDWYLRPLGNRFKKNLDDNRFKSSGYCVQEYHLEKGSWGSWINTG